MTIATFPTIASIVGLQLVVVALLVLLAFKLRKAIREIFRSLARLEKSERSAAVSRIEAKQKDTARQVKQLINKHLWPQVESLTTLYRLVDGKPDLVRTREWSLSPDMLLHIVRHIETHKPKTIVECGAGASTVVIATALRALHQDGRLISLEDDPYYASEVAQQLKRRGLDEYATVLSSPLKPRRYNGFSDAFHWYSFDPRELPDAIDLLVVDGPWGMVNRLARYPAGPELIPKLSPNAHIFLDDANREDEGRLPELWQQIRPNLEARDLGAEKGGIELVCGGFGKPRPPNIVLEKVSA